MEALSFFAASCVLVPLTLLHAGQFENDRPPKIADLNAAVQRLGQDMEVRFRQASWQAEISIADEAKKLADLHVAGVFSDSEFSQVLS